MTDEFRSPAVESFPTELQLEYNHMVQQLRAELRSVEGVSVVHLTIIDRYAFVYCALKYMERQDWVHVDMQRYNQLLGIWLKIGSDLIARYQELYKSGGAVQDVFIERILTILTEEIADDDLERIRLRMRTAQTELLTAG